MRLPSQFRPPASRVPVRRRRWFLPFSAALLGALLTGCLQPKTANLKSPETIVAEVKSDYSHIRIRAYGSLRALLFVGDDGQETRQSGIDLSAPGDLQIAYTQYQFASLLLRAPQERVLIVGLGGGSMVRFLNHHFPETQVDVVEIDPAVVALAAEHFGTRENAKTRIITEDAFAFLARDHGLYDVIYMDAFLAPDTTTDDAGLPVAGTKRAFLTGLHRHLKPGGLVAFNLIESDGTAGDLAAIRSSFPTTYIFDVPRFTNLAVFGSLDPARQPAAELRATGARLDAERKLSFSLAELVDALLAPGESPL